jgi:hypothetical protein
MKAKKNWLDKIFTSKKQDSEWGLKINGQKIPVPVDGHVQVSWKQLLQQQQPHHQTSLPADGRRMREPRWTEAMPAMPHNVSSHQAQRSGRRPRSVSPDFLHRRRYHSEFVARDHSQSPTRRDTAKNPPPSRQHSRKSKSHQLFPSTKTSERTSISSSRQRSSNHSSGKTYHPKTGQPSTMPVTEKPSDRLPTRLAPLGDNMRTNLEGLVTPAQWVETERAQKAQER